MDPYYGAIEQYDERDYLIGSIDQIPRAKYGTKSFFKTGATQYNQKDVSPTSCTVHGAMGSYSDLTGYKFQLEERKEIWEEALNRGADPNGGWYIQSAVKLVAEWVNKNCEQKVSYYRIPVSSGEFLQAMRLGYSPVIGYRGNKTYKLDRDDNGIIDNIEIGETTYGHCLRANYSIGDEFDRMVDNYPYRGTNLYLIPSSNWGKLVKNSVYFINSYIYLLND